MEFTPLTKLQGEGLLEERIKVDDDLMT